MAEVVIMPRQGQSVESCIITKWHKKEGDDVAVGDILFSYETDKSAFDEEAKVAGTLLKILRAEEDDVPCLENVCIIGNKGEDISALVKEAPAAQAEEKKEEAVQAAPAAAAAPVQTVSAAAPKDGTVFASPRAKNLAEKLNVDYTLASPTGAEGRIMERDIEAMVKNGVVAARTAVEAPAAASAAPAAVLSAEEYTDEKIPNIRKVISKAMFNSLSTTAQLTVTSSFDATEVMAFRAKIKPMAEKGLAANITLNDIVMYAVSRVLTKHRALNALMLDEQTMRFYNTVNLGMAVDTPRGLLVPTLKNADKKSISEISVELKALAKEAQGGTISPEKLSGGSFTVTNLGSFGVESFTPVLNAPQVGILGVGTITNRVKTVNGALAMYPAMTLSLTFDHRAVDGAPAAKFLKELCSALENFSVAVATLE